MMCFFNLMHHNVVQHNKLINSILVEEGNFRPFSRGLVFPLLKKPSLKPPILDKLCAVSCLPFFFREGGFF